MTRMIRVQDLVFEYPGLRALDHVSFSIAAGTITALVGPNGAGKTTLMRCLCGLERPLAGAITVDGIDVIEEPRRSHERIGFLSDFFGLYDDLTVSQCLRYAAEANGGSDGIAGLLADTATQLRLEDRLQQRAGTLSRGLRQRVAIGQALIHRPRVLILDEPASGLDPEARHDLARLFQHLQASGMTLLVSSHILAELEEYATHMLILRAGRLIEQRRLGSSDPTRRWLALSVIGETGPAVAILRSRSDVSDLETNGSDIRCSFEGGDEDQAALLRALLAAEVRVFSFGPASVDLQQSYLDTVRHRDGTTS